MSLEGIIIKLENINKEFSNQHPKEFTEILNLVIKLRGDCSIVNLRISINKINEIINDLLLPETTLEIINDCLHELNTILKRAEAFSTFIFTDISKGIKGKEKTTSSRQNRNEVKVRIEDKVSKEIEKKTAKEQNKDKNKSKATAPKKENWIWQGKLMQPTIDYIYRESEKLFPGCLWLTSCQTFLPQIGSDIGHCAGFTYEGMADILKNGRLFGHYLDETPIFKPITRTKGTNKQGMNLNNTICFNESIYRRQNEFLHIHEDEATDFVAIETLNDSNKTKNKIMQHLSKLSDAGLVLDLSNGIINIPGHVVGIIRDKKKRIVFIDANFGCFVFKKDSQFEQWFPWFLNQFYSKFYKTIQYSTFRLETAEEVESSRKFKEHQKVIDELSLLGKNCSIEITLLLSKGVHPSSDEILSLRNEQEEILKKMEILITEQYRTYFKKRTEESGLDRKENSERNRIPAKKSNNLCMRITEFITDKIKFCFGFALPILVEHLKPSGKLPYTVLPCEDIIERLTQLEEQPTLKGLDLEISNLNESISLIYSKKEKNSIHNKNINLLQNVAFPKTVQRRKSEGCLITPCHA